MSVNVEIIRTSGERENHQVGKYAVMRWISRMIGAEVLDTVNLRDGRVMLVDDNGYESSFEEVAAGHWTATDIRPRKPVNDEATKLYHGVCVPGTTHQIVGDVAIVVDEEMA